MESSETLTLPTVSTNASGASPTTVRATSLTVELCFINIQSRKTGAFGPPPAAPEVYEVMFRTVNTGTRPSSEAARARTWTTPVLPKRYSTRSFRFSMRLRLRQLLTLEFGAAEDMLTF